MTDNCDPCGEPQYEVLFGPRQPGGSGIPGISHDFHVTTSPVVITAYNMPHLGCAIVERIETHCDEPFIMNAQQPGQKCIVLCDCTTIQVLYMPGRYRVRLERVDDPESILVTQSKVTPGAQFTVPLASGGCGMSCNPCGHNISISVDPDDGTMTIILDGEAYSVTPGSQVSVQETPTHIILTVDGQSTLIPLPEPSVVTDNNDGTLTHVAGGVAVTWRRGGPSTAAGNLITLGPDGLVQLPPSVVQDLIDDAVAAYDAAHESSLVTMLDNAGQPLFRAHSL